MFVDTVVSHFTCEMMREVCLPVRLWEFKSTGDLTGTECCRYCLSLSRVDFLEYLRRKNEFVGPLTHMAGSEVLYR